MIAIEVEGQVLPVPRPTGRAPGNRKLTAYDLRASHDPHPDRPTRCVCGGPLNLALTRCIDSGWGWAPPEAEEPEGSYTDPQGRTWTLDRAHGAVVQVEDDPAEYLDRRAALEIWE